MREFRSIALTEIRVVSDAGAPPSFWARVCNYDVPDSYGTEWAPGVFADSFASKLPKCVWGHDWLDPIGRVSEYVDSPDGMDVLVLLDDFDAVPRARQAYSQLQSGTMDEFSFAFERQEQEPSPINAGVTRITKAIVSEVSPVLVGSVPGTHTISVRSDELAAFTAALSGVRSGSNTEQGDEHVTDDKPAETRTTKLGDPAVVEFRAVDADGNESDPLAILAEVDTAIGELQTSLNAGDLEASRRWFQCQASKIGELLYLLGMNSDSPDWYGYRANPEAEKRAAEDARLDAALAGLASRRRR